MGESRVLSDAKTPEQWVEILAAKGIGISERTLRERARKIGACRILGNAMILYPEHIDKVFEEPTQCQRATTNSTVEATFGGSPQRSTESEAAKALEKLMKGRRDRRPASASSNSVVKLHPNPPSR